MPSESEPDLSEFVALSGPGHRRKPCRIAVAKETLSPEEAKQLEAAVKATTDGLITVGAVVKWLEKRGHQMNQNSVVHHRARRCSCDG